MSNIFATRTVGETGLSIGTHLAMETFFSNNMLDVFDPDREFVKVDPNNYNYHVFNIYTLVRNIINSVTDNKIKEEILLHSDFIPTLKKELKIITSLYGSCSCKPVLFYPNYDKIYKRYNKGKDSGITVVYKEHMMIKSILEKLDARETIHSCNDGKGYKIPGFEDKKANIVITTNIPVDLFNFKGRVDLLESHTGKIKTPSMFNSKYHSIGQANLSHLPFVEELVYLLGDGTIVLPCKISVRKIVYDISKEFNWTPKTTREKVVSNLKRDNIVQEVLKNFTRSYS